MTKKCSAAPAHLREKCSSVVQLRFQDVEPQIIGPQVLAGMQLAESDLEAGALVTITPQRTRIRLLPF
jgi:predicted nuclease of predicted toxin-antitoxin system